MCNQVGYSTHPQLRGKWFPGVALVADPAGEIVAASHDPRQEELLVVQLDPALFAEKRQKRAFPPNPPSQSKAVPAADSQACSIICFAGKRSNREAPSDKHQLVTVAQEGSFC